MLLILLGNGWGRAKGSSCSPDWCNDIVGMMPPKTKRSKMVFVKVIRGLPCVSCQACSVLDL